METRLGALKPGPALLVPFVLSQIHSSAKRELILLDNRVSTPYTHTGNSFVFVTSRIPSRRCFACHCLETYRRVGEYPVSDTSTPHWSAVRRTRLASPRNPAQHQLQFPFCPGVPRGEWMSGLWRVACYSHRNSVCRAGIFLFLAISSCLACAFPAAAQQRREREPNSVYAQRRAKLASQVDGPILLFGFSGREEDAQTYIFSQEEDFYYLTGHNEEEAALLILPGGKTWVPKPETSEKVKSSVVDGGLAPDILFLPA